MELNVKAAGVLCGAVGILLYANSLGLGFCLDDEAAVVGNADLRGNVSWFGLLNHDFWGIDISDTDSHKSYRPLTVATFRLNYMLHELEPLGYHLVNVLLHGGVCYLYVLLCGVVFGEVWPALIAGLLFAVHPIHTEAVSGIVGRADILCSFFTILSIFAYRKSLSKMTKVERMSWFAVSLLLILLAALSKEIGITATALCLVYQLTLHRHTNRNCTNSRAAKTNGLVDWRASIRELWLSARDGFPRAITLALFALTFLWARLRLNKGPPLFHVHNNPALGFVSPYRQLHWSYLCVLNVWLLLSPSQLCAEYAMDTIPPISSLSDPRNLLTLASSLSLLFLIVYSIGSPATHQRTTLFGLCLTTVPFLPASNLFFPVGFVIAERVLYLPSMGFCLLISYGFHLLLLATKNTTKLATNHLKSFTKFTIVLILFSQSLKTVTRNWDWSDNLTLFSSALRVSQQSAKMWNFVGNSHFKAGNNSLAEPCFLKSLEIQPLFVLAHINLVRIYKREKRFDEAIEHAELASEMVVDGIGGGNPHYYHDDKKVFLELARLLLLHTNRFEDALKWSKYAATAYPEWESAFEIMGKVFIKLGKHSSAVKALRKAIKLKNDDNFPAAHFSLGEALRNEGDLEEAEYHYRIAVSLDNTDNLNKFSLVKIVLDNRVAHTTRRLTEALHMALDVLELEPENGNLTLTVALLYWELGESEKALQYIDNTLVVNPQYPTYCHDKGKMLYELKHYREAEEVLSTCSHDNRINTTQSYLFLRGTNLLVMKKNEEAREYLKMAYQLAPSDEATRVNYGIVLIHTNHSSEALEIFKKLADEQPDNVTYRKQVHFLSNTSSMSSLSAKQSIN